MILRAIREINKYTSKIVISKLQVRKWKKIIQHTNLQHRRCIKIFIRDASDISLWTFFCFKLNSTNSYRAMKNQRKRSKALRWNIDFRKRHLKRFTTSRCIKIFTRDASDISLDILLFAFKIKSNPVKSKRKRSKRNVDFPKRLKRFTTFYWNVNKGSASESTLLVSD